MPTVLKACRRPFRNSLGDGSLASANEDHCMMIMVYIEGDVEGMARYVGIEGFS